MYVLMVIFAVTVNTNIKKYDYHAKFSPPFLSEKECDEALASMKPRFPEGFAGVCVPVKNETEA